MHSLLQLENIVQLRTYIRIWLLFADHVSCVHFVGREGSRFSTCFTDPCELSTHIMYVYALSKAFVIFISSVYIQGVMEFAFALFFSKLVSYAFLFWLPFYIINTSKCSLTGV